MILQDNIIKEYLKNVYFFSGTPCGGKTTISRELSKRHGFIVYGIDEQFENHKKLSNSDFQPSMNKAFKNADEFFGRTVDEYKKWLIDNTREQLDFVILDLIRLSQNQIVLCDCHLTLEEARKFTEPSRIVFLIKEPSNIVDDYCNRPDHQGFSNFINSTSDPKKAKAICNDTLKSLNEKRFNNIKNSEYFWVERTKLSTVEDTVKKVEQHFGFLKNDLFLNSLQIIKVEKGSDLADKLIGFVENFSWTEVQDHILSMLRNWEFTDWETPFAATVNGRIVGMTTIMKTDYYPLPEIFPWISCIFVSEEYRGNRISEKLIDFANSYAKKLGFSQTYIPSSHIGLYEKYGYEYQRDIVNYGNETDRLYSKKLG